MTADRDLTCCADCDVLRAELRDRNRELDDRTRDLADARRNSEIYLSRLLAYSYQVGDPAVAWVPEAQL